MIKPTKRKAFNFLRSYFDVLNELENDSDKLNFLMSIINKQFLNEDPKKLNFIVNLCYESQRHQIESSVKGWERASNDTLSTTPMTTPMTTLSTPKQEEEEEEEVKEEEEEEKTIFSFYDFWKCYPQKKGKAECEKKYKKISEADRLIIKNTINDFISDKPFKDYTHPNPLTYINQKRWLDNVDEDKKQIPLFEFDFKKYGGDINLFNKLKKEHEQRYS